MSNDPANPPFTPLDVPPEGLETPHGRLYRPLGDGMQILVLIAAFFAGPLIGWSIGQIPGDLSPMAQDAMFVPMAIVFFLGHGLWIARLNAIAFQGIGWGLVKALARFILYRRKPKSLHDVLPSRDKLLEMLVRAQKAGASFPPMGWLTGLVSGLIAMLFDSNMSGLSLFFLVGGGCVIWGHTLAWLGRHGWLPFAENE